MERLTWGEDGAVRMTDVDAPTIEQNVDVSTIEQRVGGLTMEQRVGGLTMEQNVDVPTIALSGSKQFTDEKQISCFT